MAETRITNGNRNPGRSEKRSTLSARNSHGAQAKPRTVSTCWACMKKPPINM